MIKHIIVRMFRHKINLINTSRISKQVAGLDGILRAFKTKLVDSMMAISNALINNCPEITYKRSNKIILVYGQF